MSNDTKLKHYFSITKPGIILGNLISVTGGFLLASKQQINWSLFFAVLLGSAGIIAAGCIFNNYIDRDIDSKMQRTKHRVLVKGEIPNTTALGYACLLGIAGFTIIYLTTNLLTFAIAWMGFIVYVLVYSLYMKRRSLYATLVGSLSGATPPLIGYCAVTQQFDMGAFILLTLFCLWQIPHSYAIAIFRSHDYIAADIPILPVKTNITATKISIVLYITAFTLSALLLTLTGYTGYYYFYVAIIVSCCWLVIALYGYLAANNNIWAKQIFIFSIITIASLSIMMSIDTLPFPQASSPTY